jgi:hypothetical protein
MSNIVSPGFTTPWIFREVPGVVSEGGGEKSSCEGRGWMEIPVRRMAIEIGIIGMIRFITPPTHMVVGNILYTMIIPSTPKCRKWHSKGETDRRRNARTDRQAGGPRFVGLFGRVERD